jgi:hypothetical protein
MFAEQAGELHLFGPTVGADALKGEILGRRSAGRQGAALSGHRFDLAPQRQFGFNQDFGPPGIPGFRWENADAELLTLRSAQALAQNVAEARLFRLVRAGAAADLDQWIELAVDEF